VMNRIRARLLAEGLTTFILKNMVFVVPPLVISESELADGLAIIERSLALADAVC
jgi:taurine---2-oxoglutarate transaminase